MYLPISIVDKNIAKYDGCIFFYGQWLCYNCMKGDSPWKNTFEFKLSQTIPYKSFLYVSN